MVLATVAGNLPTSIRSLGGSGANNGLSRLLPASTLRLYVSTRVSVWPEHSNLLGNDSDYGCPQTFPQGLEGLRINAPNGGFGGGSWGMAQGVWLELLIPLAASQPHSGNQQIRFRVNPDIGVVGYPSVPLLVNNDVLFRHSLEDNQLVLDICTVAPIPNGC